MKPNGSSYRGRAVGQEAFFNALHRKAYAGRSGKSSTGSERHGAAIPIRVDGPYGRQCAGYVVVEGGRRILRKTNIRESVHYCHRHRGYGVELDALRQAELLGAGAVWLVFADGQRLLEAPISAFANEGIRDALGGFGVQVFLPAESWRDLSDPQGSLLGGAANEH